MIRQAGGKMEGLKVDDFKVASGMAQVDLNLEIVESKLKGCFVYFSITLTCLIQPPSSGCRALPNLVRRYQ